jgi:hypothetical protein
MDSASTDANNPVRTPPYVRPAGDPHGTAQTNAHRDRDPFPYPLRPRLLYSYSERIHLVSEPALLLPATAA